MSTRRKPLKWGARRIRRLLEDAGHRAAEFRRFVIFGGRQRCLVRGGFEMSYAGRVVFWQPQPLGSMFGTYGVLDLDAARTAAEQLRAAGVPVRMCATDPGTLWIDPANALSEAQGYPPSSVQRLNADLVEADPWPAVTSAEYRRQVEADGAAKAKQALVDMNKSLAGLGLAIDVGDAMTPRTVS